MRVPKTDARTAADYGLSGVPTIQETIFWTGAGISNAPPASLPLGAELTTWLLNVVTPRKTLDVLAEAYRRGRFADAFGNPRRLPRLELLFSCAVRNLGTKAGFLTKSLTVPQPNNNHTFFASHIIQRGIHITMNIDDGIPKALAAKAVGEASIVAKDFANSRSDLSGSVVMLHGRVNPESEDELLRLGIVLDNITSGIPNQFASVLHKSLQKARLLAFLGYGGLDHFDVTPFFQSIPPSISLSGLTVLWINHAFDEGPAHLHYSQLRSGGANILAGLEARGAKVLCVEDDTAAFLTFIANAWRLPYEPPEPREPGERSWGSDVDRTRHDFNITPQDRRLVALDLMARLGIGKEAVRLAEWLAPHEESLQLMPNPRTGQGVPPRLLWIWHWTNGYRDLGRYSKALQIWSKPRRCFERIHPLFRLLKEERVAGELRMRGHRFGLLITLLRLEVGVRRFDGYCRATPEQLKAMLRRSGRRPHGMLEEKVSLWLFSEGRAFKIVLDAYRTLFDAVVSISSTWWGRFLRRYTRSLFERLRDFNDQVAHDPHTYGFCQEAVRVRFDHLLRGIREGADVPRSSLSQFEETDSLIGIVNT